MASLECGIQVAFRRETLDSFSMGARPLAKSEKAAASGKS
jgi:hypothetical protein